MLNSLRSRLFSSKVTRSGMEEGMRCILEIIYSKDPEVFDLVEGTLEDVNLKIGKQPYDLIELIEKVRTTF